MTTQVRDVAVRALIEDNDAVESTIQFVRERLVGDDIVLAVLYRESSGRLRRGFVGAHRFADGTWTSTSGWSSGVRDARPSDIWQNSGGWGSSRTGSIGVSGGWVADTTAESIQVTDPR
jgi:hypothetical protein